MLNIKIIRIGPFFTDLFKKIKRRALYTRKYRFNAVTLLAGERKDIRSSRKSSFRNRPKFSLLCLCGSVLT